MQTVDAEKRSLTWLPDSLEAFQFANFRWLWSGWAASSLSRSMRVFLRAIIVYEMTNSAIWLAAVSASISAPMLFMPFVGGVIADRVDRRKLVLVTEGLLGVLWTAMAALIISGGIEAWHFIISSLISGVVQSIGRPGHQTMVANVVDRHALPNAVALDSIAQSGPGILAPAIAGILMVLVGGGWAFLVSAVLQWYTVISLLMMEWKTDAGLEAVSRRRTAVSDLTEGFRFIWSEKVLLSLITVGVCGSVLGGSYAFLLPVFKDILGTDSVGLSMLYTASSIGGLTGTVAAAGLSRFRRLGWLLLVTSLGYAALIVAFANSRMLLFSVCILFSSAAMHTLFSVVTNSILQLSAPDHLRGRIMAVRTFIQGLSPIGLSITATVAQFWGAPAGVALGGSLYGLAALVVFLWNPHLRNFNAEESATLKAAREA